MSIGVPRFQGSSRGTSRTEGAKAPEVLEGTDSQDQEWLWSGATILCATPNP